jgi:hypothetical protein
MIIGVVAYPGGGGDVYGQDSKTTAVTVGLFEIFDIIFGPLCDR